jgi:hypothetical protein
MPEGEEKKRKKKAGERARRKPFAPHAIEFIGGVKHVGGKAVGNKKAKASFEIQMTSCTMLLAIPHCLQHFRPAQTIRHFFSPTLSYWMQQTRQLQRCASEFSRV